MENAHIISTAEAQVRTGSQGRQSVTAVLKEDPLFSQMLLSAPPLLFLLTWYSGPLVDGKANFTA